MDVDSAQQKDQTASGSSRGAEPGKSGSSDAAAAAREQRQAAAADDAAARDAAPPLPATPAPSPLAAAVSTVCTVLRHYQDIDLEARQARKEVEAAFKPIQKACLTRSGAPAPDNGPAASFDGATAALGALADLLGSPKPLVVAAAACLVASLAQDSPVRAKVIAQHPRVVPALAAALGNAAVAGAHSTAAVAAFHVAWQAAAGRRDRGWFEFSEPPPLVAGEAQLARALCAFLADDLDARRYPQERAPQLSYAAACLRGERAARPDKGAYNSWCLFSSDVAGALLEFLVLRSEAAAAAAAAPDARLLPALGAAVAAMRSSGDIDTRMQLTPTAHAFRVLHALARAATSEVC